MQGSDASTPVDVNQSPMGYQFSSRPPTGSLRVDTSALDTATTKQQNKSAYPSFAGNSIMLPVNQDSIKSPIPVTAGPDLGRHNLAREAIVGYNEVR